MFLYHAGTEFVELVQIVDQHTDPAHIFNYRTGVIQESIFRILR